MARNGSGTYSKVNTFVAGNTITAAGHNENWDDLVTEMTNSVAADGQTTMTAGLKLANGSAAAPALTFGTDTNNGLYRIGADNLGFTLNGSKVGDWSTTGLAITGTLSASGAVTASSTLAVTGNVAVNTNKFNITAASGNTTVAGTLGVTGAVTNSSTTEMTGDVTVNTNKLTVTAANGNTAVAGTLAVTGNATLTADVSAATVSGAVVATQANMETGTATNLLVTPGRQHFHPGHPKLWIKCDSAGATNDSYNITSITDTGVGTLDVTIATDFTDTDYVVNATAQSTGNNDMLLINNSTPPTAGTFRISSVNPATSSSHDPSAYHISGFGDQA
jgi:hypothetical protein